MPVAAPPRPARRAARVALAALLLAAAPLGAATPAAPVVDASGLPALDSAWPAENPYRGNAQAAEVGRLAFNQACAACHGADADGARAPAPDLRRLGRSCKRVSAPQWRQRCVEDVDYYFRKSVMHGKIKAGIEHMPPWEGVLSPELVWAIRTFIESAAASPR